MAKGGQPRAPRCLLLYPLPGPTTIQHRPTSASCSSRIAGLTRLALGHKLKYPFYNQGLGEREGALSVNEGLVLGRLGPIPHPSPIPRKSL